MTDPVNPRLSAPELLERILRQNPHLTRETVLAVAASAGFDLLELGKPTTGASRPPVMPGGKKITRSGESTGRTTRPVS